MPANKNIAPLLGGGYYHIFNRGINRNTIFFQSRNYDYFLSLWYKYLSGYTEVLAYCLIPNHFHFLIKVKEKIEVSSENNSVHLIKDEEKIGEIVSERFRRLFISYSQAINKQENRCGSLFTRNFKRIELHEDSHLKYLFFYIHYNPLKHSISPCFKSYKYSSFKAYISDKPTNVSKNLGLELFDGLDAFLSFHKFLHEEKENLIFE